MRGAVCCGVLVVAARTAHRAAQRSWVVPSAPRRRGLSRSPSPVRDERVEQRRLDGPPHSRGISRPGPQLPGCLPRAARRGNGHEHVAQPPRTGLYTLEYIGTASMAALTSDRTVASPGGTGSAAGGLFAWLCCPLRLPSKVRASSMLSMRACWRARSATFELSCISRASCRASCRPCPMPPVAGESRPAMCGALRALRPTEPSSGPSGLHCVGRGRPLVGL